MDLIASMLRGLGLFLVAVRLVRRASLLIPAVAGDPGEDASIGPTV